MRLVRCDRCGKEDNVWATAERGSLWKDIEISLERMDSAERALKGFECITLCPECAKLYEDLVRSFVRGGECITLVKEDGSVEELPLPHVPDDVKKLDEFMGGEE